MTAAFLLLVHLLTTLARMLRPGGARAIVAESLLLKQQLLVVSTNRQRVPNLEPTDRFLLGFLALFLRPHRITRVAIVVRPSTLLHFHQASCARNTANSSRRARVQNRGRRAHLPRSSKRYSSSSAQCETSPPHCRQPILASTGRSDYLESARCS